MQVARFFLASLSVAVLDCTPQQYDPALSPNPQIITQDEVVSSGGNSAYDVIKKIHGNFLSYRGRTSITDTTTAMPMVFMDDQFYGPLAVLRNIPAIQISEIRLYRAWEATFKYGSGLPGGAISIKTRLDN